MDSADSRREATDLSRRRFLSYGLGGLGLGAVVGGSAISAQFLRELYVHLGAPVANPANQKVSTLLAGITSLLDHSAPNFDSIRESLGRFRKLASELSEGTLAVERWSESKEQENTLPRAYFSTPLVMRGAVPGIEALWQLPYGMSPLEKLSWLQSPETEASWAELYRPLGLRALSFGLGGCSLAVVSGKPLESIADFRGLTVASHSKQKTWLSRLGLVEKYVDDLSAIPKKLESGEIDVTMPLAHSVHLNLGTLRSGRYYYENSWAQTVVPYELVMHDTAWAALGDKAQFALRKAAHFSGSEYTAGRLQEEEIALGTLRSSAEGGLLKLPKPVLDEFAKLNQEALLSKLGTSLAANRLVEKQKIFT